MCNIVNKLKLFHFNIHVLVIPHVGIYMTQISAVYNVWSLVCFNQKMEGVKMELPTNARITHSCIFLDNLSALLSQNNRGCKDIKVRFEESKTTIKAPVTKSSYGVDFTSSHLKKGEFTDKMPFTGLFEYREETNHYYPTRSTKDWMEWLRYRSSIRTTRKSTSYITPMNHWTSALKHISTSMVNVFVENTINEDDATISSCFVLVPEYEHALNTPTSACVKVFCEVKNLTPSECVEGKVFMGRVKTKVLTQITLKECGKAHKVTVVTMSEPEHQYLDGNSVGSPPTDFMFCADFNNGVQMIFGLLSE